MTDAMYIILHTECLYFDTRKKRSSAGRFFCPALHSIIYYSLYFLLPAHASAHRIGKNNIIAFSNVFKVDFRKEAF